MTVTELKYKVLEHNPDSHFFDRKTLKFFGDTMQNYGVRQAAITREGRLESVWCLYRKRPVKYGLSASSYFEMNTFKRAWPDR